MIFAVDPGPEQSALVIYEPSAARIVEHVTAENPLLLDRFSHRTRAASDWLVVEQVASFGMAVGADVFETVFWTGRFIQAWAGYHASMPWARVKRHEVKTHLCHSMRAKDANIRQALIDRFGPTKDRAIGTKNKPGQLYGISGDQWSALAVAVTWADQHHADGRRHTA